MIRLVIALALLLGVAFAAPDPVRESKHSAVSIAQQDGTRYCSGAVVNLPQGPRIVSAGHCAVEVGQRVYVQDIQGNQYLARVEEMHFDWPEDYAVIRSVAQWLLPALEVGGPMTIGDTYYSWASPHGYELLFFRGMYAGTIMPNESGDGLDPTGMPFLAIDGAGGSSGSIILDSRGRAVAIHVGGMLGNIIPPEGFNPPRWVRIPVRGGLLAPLPRGDNT